MCKGLNLELYTHTNIGRTNVMHKLFVSIGTTCMYMYIKRKVYMCKNYQHEY